MPLDEAFSLSHAGARALPHDRKAWTDHLKRAQPPPGKALGASEPPHRPPQTHSPQTLIFTCL